MKHDDLFKKFHLEKPRRHSLDGRESVEEFIDRGGLIEHVDSSVMRREDAKKKHASSRSLPSGIATMLWPLTRG